jgi:anaerobic selenocysteine-containing dehydrogenase
LAKAMGMTDPEFDIDDESLIRSALIGTDVDLMRKQGFVRLNLPDVVMPYAEGGFNTEDGRASLFSSPFPEYHPVSERPGSALAERYPLMLLTAKNHTRFLNSSYSHHHGEKEEGPFFEIDPADASARGIGDGDHVRVYNDRAELVVVAKLSSRLRPGVTMLPWGWWMDAAHANALTNDKSTDWGGGVAYSDTLVEAAPYRDPGS